MVLSESKSSFVKVFISAWGVAECLLLAGIAYGWSSFVFIFKREGIFSHLCESKHENASDTVTNKSVFGVDLDGRDIVSTESSLNSTGGAGTRKVILYDEQHPTCLEQDSMLSLCFTVGILTYCVFGCIIGQINYYFGTRVARLISL